MSEAYSPGGNGQFRSVDLGRGTSPSGVRLYNERLVLSLVRKHRSLPKAEIARLTGLSAQTASVIMNRLEADGLVRKGKRQRGRIGQPSVPFSLNPEGAFAFGLKIGRRSADLVLIDFQGTVRNRLHMTYAYPLPSTLLAFAVDGVSRMEADMPPGPRSRIVGVGLGSPDELWNWAYEVGAPPGTLDAWRDFDLRAEFQASLGHQVYLCNDATAACAAELVFGKHEDILDFLYIFIGSFVGGGLVLNRMLVPGRSGKAAALGSMPVPDANGAVHQLIHSASLYQLEARLTAAGKAAGWLWADPDAWRTAESELDDWIIEAASSLAFAVTAASSVMDFQAVVLDGAFPDQVRTRLVAALTERITHYDRQGLGPIRILPGTIGAAAREVGAGSLPLIANFAADREVLFKEMT